jgi:hypothetical protein
VADRNGLSEEALNLFSTFGAAEMAELSRSFSLATQRHPIGIRHRDLQSSLRVR